MYPSIREHEEERTGTEDTKIKDNSYKLEYMATDQEAMILGKCPNSGIN